MSINRLSSNPSIEFEINKPDSKCLTVPPEFSSIIHSSTPELDSVLGMTEKEIDQLISWNEKKNKKPNNITSINSSRRRSFDTQRQNSQNQIESSLFLSEGLSIKIETPTPSSTCVSDDIKKKDKWSKRTSISNNNISGHKKNSFSITENIMSLGFLEKSSSNDLYSSRRSLSNLKLSLMSLDDKFNADSPKSSTTPLTPRQEGKTPRSASFRNLFKTSKLFSPKFNDSSSDEHFRSISLPVEKSPNESIIINKSSDPEFSFYPNSEPYDDKNIFFQSKNEKPKSKAQSTFFEKEQSKIGSWLHSIIKPKFKQDEGMINFNCIRVQITNQYNQEDEIKFSGPISIKDFIYEVFVSCAISPDQQKNFVLSLLLDDQCQKNETNFNKKKSNSESSKTSGNSLIDSNKLKNVSELELCEAIKNNNGYIKLKITTVKPKIDTKSILNKNEEILNASENNTKLKTSNNESNKSNRVTKSLQKENNFGNKSNKKSLSKDTNFNVSSKSLHHRTSNLNKDSIANTSGRSLLEASGKSGRSLKNYKGMNKLMCNYSFEDSLGQSFEESSIRPTKEDIISNLRDFFPNINNLENIENLSGNSSLSAAQRSCISVLNSPISKTFQHLDNLELKKNLLNQKNVSLKRNTKFSNIASAEDAKLEAAFLEKDICSESLDIDSLNSSGPKNGMDFSNSIKLNILAKNESQKGSIQQRKNSTRIRRNLTVPSTPNPLVKPATNLLTDSEITGSVENTHVIKLRVLSDLDIANEKFFSSNESLTFDCSRKINPSPINFLHIFNEKEKSQSQFLLNHRPEIRLNSSSNLNINTNSSAINILNNIGENLDTSIKTNEVETTKELGVSRTKAWYQGDLIGRGAFGSVFLGLNFETWELMAVKQVELNKIQKYDTTKGEMSPENSLKLEISLLKVLDDVNIVKYLDFEVTPTHFNIFLEYVPGGSIASVLNRSGPFPDKLVKILNFQILNGLEYLHKVGVIHRDIKAANILIDMDGIVKITDFGVSKQLEKKDGEEDAAYNVRSSLNSIRGTPSWMAPEIVDQHGYSAKVDIWSFGCVMLEMLSGHKPWDQFNNELQIFKQLGQKNSPELPSGISDDALSMMKSCFEFEPNLRPTASDLIEHPYVSGVDPLDQNYFNFSEFLRKVEEEYQIRKAKEMEEYSDSNSDEEHNVEEDEEYCTEEIAEASEEDSIYESEEIIEEN